MARLERQRQAHHDLSGGGFEDAQAAFGPAAGQDLPAVRLKSEHGRLRPGVDGPFDGRTGQRCDHDAAILHATRWPRGCRGSGRSCPAARRGECGARAASVAKGNSTSAAGSRYSTQRASPEGDSCMPAAVVAGPGASGDRVRDGVDLVDGSFLRSQDVDLGIRSDEPGRRRARRRARSACARGSGEVDDGDRAAFLIGDEAEAAESGGLPPPAGKQAGGGDAAERAAKYRMGALTVIVLRGMKRPRKAPPWYSDTGTSRQLELPRAGFLFPNRRDGRVVEGARLESVYRGNSIEGSNPSLSATFQDIGAFSYKKRS